MTAIVPSFALYTDLKTFGKLRHVDAATILLSDRPVYGGISPRSRVGERTFLSREIVRAAPGTLPETFFAPFDQSVLTIASRIASNLREGRGNQGADEPANLPYIRIRDHYLGEAAEEMRRALCGCGLDDRLYGNAAASIGRMGIRREEDRAVLALMLFAVTGCLGSCERAIEITECFMQDSLSMSFHTIDLADDPLALKERPVGGSGGDTGRGGGRGGAATSGGRDDGSDGAPGAGSAGRSVTDSQEPAPAPVRQTASITADADDAGHEDDEAPEVRLGLARMIKGAIRPTIYTLSTDPEGTTIGALATGANRIIDVGTTCSRVHLRIWRDGTRRRWFCVGVGSTNGTLLRTVSGKTVVVEPPRAHRAGFSSAPVEIHPGDYLQLGSDTTFMVLPIAPE